MQEPSLPSWAERLYRNLDRRLFGRGHWVAREAVPVPEAAEPGALRLLWRRGAVGASHADCLCVEYEGMPMDRLEDAVRLRLGHPGATLCARVWLLRPSQPPLLAMQGWLRLDHRSLCRSVVLCAGKLPALLRAAQARVSRLPAVSTAWREAGAVAPALDAGQQIARLVRAVWTWLRWREQWQIEVRSHGASGAMQHGTVVVVRPPPSAFWADPFLLRRGDRAWILFEGLDFKENRGHICAVEIGAAGAPIAAPQVVLREPWHLSYPFLWHEGDRLFMIPEAGECRELTLYEAVGDGLHWERRRVLISGVRLADATVVAHGGRLWMFATSADEGIAFMDDALHVYWAEHIEGPWHAHALNPVKIDARCARPAGSMWVEAGKVHRVAQDCSSTYGGSVRCMRVTCLTETEFEEEEVVGWSPRREASSDPWHTYNEIDGFTVTDRLVKIPRWRAR
ncbi:MAG: hypothetical protein U1E63_15105 [Burkholderiales bacterium]